MSNEQEPDWGAEADEFYTEPEPVEEVSPAAKRLNGLLAAGGVMLLGGLAMAVITPAPMMGATRSSRLERQKRQELILQAMTEESKETEPKDAE